MTARVAVAADGEVATFGELDMLRAKGTVLEAQVRNAELQKKLNDLNGSLPAGAPQSSGFGVAPVQPHLVSGFAARTAVVQSVSNNTAVITLPSGTSIAATPGAKIPGVGVVRKVSIREVLVQDGKLTSALPFAGDMPATTTMPAATPLQMPVGQPVQFNGAR